MSEEQQISPDAKADLKSARRFVLWTLFGLIVSFTAGMVSLITGVASVSHHSSSAGSLTTVIHHTFWSRSILCVGLAFHLVVIAGIFQRSLLLWRAVYALPVVLALLAGFVVWPQLDHSDPIAGVAVPLVMLLGMGTWQSFIWRKRWASCDSYFK